MTKTLIWVDIRKKSNGITPTYYFDFDMLNQLGFPDREIFSFIEEMKLFAEKEANERKKEPSKK